MGFLFRKRMGFRFGTFEADLNLDNRQVERGKFIEPKTT